jgi:hypothetical protein
VTTRCHVRSTGEGRRGWYGRGKEGIVRAREGGQVHLRQETEEIYEGGVRAR